MFDMLRPPLLVHMINNEHIALFPANEGYQSHPFSEDHTLVGYSSRWTFPLSVPQQKCVSVPPMLLVRNSGGVTSSSSTTTKGYAHEFCLENGQEPECFYKQNLFPEKSNDNWMLIQNTVTMIWFQYGNKTQYYSTGDLERIYYGKLLIRKFDITEDVAPGFDKKADIMSLHSKQLRVESHHIYLGGWNVTDDSPELHLNTLLSSNNLGRYIKAVNAALKRASGE